MEANEEEKQTVFKEEDDASAENSSKDKTSSGLEENMAAALTYLFGFVTGLIFLFLEKENRFIRYHALQSIIVSVALIILYIFLSIFTMVIPIVGWIIGILSLFLFPAYLVLWIFMMVKAYQKTWFKLPFAGDMAEKQLDNIGNKSKD